MDENERVLVEYAEWDRAKALTMNKDNWLHLPGWKLISVSLTPDIDDQAVTTARIEWTFARNGSGDDATP